MLLVRELAPGHRQTLDVGSNVSSVSATRAECYFLTICSCLVLCSVLYVRTKCPPSGTKRMRSLAKGRKTMSISVSVSKLGRWVVPFSCRCAFCTNDFALRHSTECLAGVLWAWHRTPLLLCESGNCERCAVGGWLETIFVWRSQQCGRDGKRRERCCRLTRQYTLVLVLESHAAVGRAAWTQRQGMSLFLGSCNL